MEKKPSKDSSSSTGPPDLVARKKELTEAMKKDMENRARLARQEIDAVCKKHRVEILCMPNFRELPGGVFGLVGQAIIKAQE